VGGKKTKGNIILARSATTKVLEMKLSWSGRGPSVVVQIECKRVVRVGKSARLTQKKDHFMQSAEGSKIHKNEGRGGKKEKKKIKKKKKKKKKKERLTRGGR